jgi:hypothetical protein
VAGNALEIAGWTVRESSCGIVRAFEPSRARQLLCAVSVPEIPARLRQYSRFPEERVRGRVRLHCMAGGWEPTGKLHKFLLHSKCALVRRGTNGRHFRSTD